MNMHKYAACYKIRYSANGRSYALVIKTLKHANILWRSFFSLYQIKGHRDLIKELDKIKQEYSLGLGIDFQFVVFLFHTF